MSLLVNLFGGPGVGKSTHAARLFSDIKQRGVNAEVAHEYAKDLTWEERSVALDFQPYVTGKQIYHVHRLQGKVDVIVTDSPILFALVYKGEGFTHSFAAYVLDVFRSWDTLNIFLFRNTTLHPYDPHGRKQNQQEAMDVDARVIHMLTEYQIPFETVAVDKRTSGTILDKTLAAIKERDIACPN